MRKLKLTWEASGRSTIYKVVDKQAFLVSFFGSDRVPQGVLVEDLGEVVDKKVAVAEPKPTEVPKKKKEDGKKV